MSSSALSVETQVEEPDFESSKMTVVSANTDGIGLNMVIRQDPFSITLDGSAVVALALGVVLGMHYLQRTLFECLLLLVPIILLVRNDYLNFLKLGPGGTPPTFAGYLRLAWFRLFALRDPFSPPAPDPSRSPQSGILKNLPYRPGPRPTVAGLAPQRQLDQHAPMDCSRKLKAAIQTVTRHHPQKLGTATSCVEKHGFGLFARHPVNAFGNGEVCHIHDVDRSMHMSLHPDDIKEVLLKGWGQRHPLAVTKWVTSPLPNTFVLIYAPRGTHR